MNKTYEIRVKGLVQGVGFRPFIYRLARKHNLKGFVLNDSQGVKIEVSGLSGSIENFMGDIRNSPPPLSEITSIESKKISLQEHEDFSIVESHKGKKIETLISPDIATCRDCHKDLRDPTNRRYLYPFTNCTNCGPRFTIIEKLPYDRPYTTMSRFRMCKECAREYEDPLNRRFHAQPNACPACGPRLKLLNKNLKVLKTKDPLGLAIKYLKQGKIIAIKGLGGFHLACDATNNKVIVRLRLQKGREEKPLAIMTAGIEEASSIAKLSAEEKGLLESPERPIALASKKPKNGIAQSVAPSNSHFGIMLPYTPFHHLLFAYDPYKRKIRERGSNFKALVMTSANMSEEPIVIHETEAHKNIRGAFDYILSNNRPIKNRADDSVIRNEAGSPLLIRRSRGFAPSPVFVKTELKEILALGAELKNTVCVTKGNNVFLSQHIGDLKNVENYDFFKEAIEHLQTTLKIKPETIVFDMHPNYLNTKFALESEFENKIAVQHHHAHMASCMIENDLDSKVIGIIADGTGYGIDGTIWGGEVLLGDLGGFERKAHLRKIPMPGGDSAANEPYRMAFAYLFAAYGKYWQNLDLNFINRIGRDRLKFLERMLNSKVNTPLTSSLGRLFDAVSSLRGLRDINTYEGQAAFELEMASHSRTKTFYSYTIYSEGGSLIINTVPMIEEIIKDLKENRKRIIGSKFHNTIISAFVDTTKRISKASGVKSAVLSGGCFQNAYLLRGIARNLKKLGMKVYINRKVPPNDGGICLGQAAVANKIINLR